VQLATLALAGLSLLVLGGVLYSLVRANRRRVMAEGVAIASEQRLRVTLASIGDAVIATDTAGIVVYLNAVAQALTGFRDTDANGLPLDQVFRIVNEQTRETVESPFSKVMREGAVVGLANHTVLIARDGSECPIDDSGAPIRNAAGEIMGVVLVFRDVTARRLSELARERLIRAELARDAAESASRAKDEFLAIVSHELRSPLAAAATWVDLLRTANLDPSQQARGLATIERNLRQQARLIDDLLDVSRIVAGKLTIDCVPVDLAGVAKAAVEDARDKAEAKSVALRFDAPPGPAMAYADAGRFLQVLANLLDNAVKFTPSGGAVDVALRARERSIEIEVRDNGDGISAEFLPNIFERFWQAQGAMRRGQAGMGLGLAIVRHLVELHGGSLVAESEGEKRGAVFRVTIPAIELRAAEVALPKRGTGARSLAGVRVLLVEDHGDSREAMVLALRSRGAEVRAAASAREALELAARELPGILVSDIGMPEMSGLELIGEVRRRAAEHGVRVPAIALTGFASAQERQQALGAGYDKHLPKPVDLKQLIDAMRALVPEAD
jgi:PAS domain S-box-containing protein